MRSLLLDLAEENRLLRQEQGHAGFGPGRIELQNMPGGQVQLCIDGHAWQQIGASAAQRHGRNDVGLADHGDTCRHHEAAAAAVEAAAPLPLSSEEKEAMDAAAVKIAAMNSEVDRARVDGKLILPPSRSHPRVAPRPAGAVFSVAGTGSAPPVAVEAAIQEVTAAPLSSSIVAPGQDRVPAARPLGPESFKKLGMLGKGAVGKCYLVREKGTNQLYAMKVMGKADISKRNKNKRIMLEREVMTMNRHPLVVALHASFQSTDFLYHVMEYCPGGPLYGVLRRQPYCRFDEASSRFYVGVRKYSQATPFRAVLWKVWICYRAVSTALTRHPLHRRLSSLWNTFTCRDTCTGT
jgi:hypothetical protein